MRHTNPIGVLIGLFVIFLALMVFAAAARRFGEGSCLTGCCMWELAESLMDVGCGLIGCGGALTLLAVPLLAYVGWLHR